MFARVHAPCCSIVVFWRFFRWVHQKFDVLWRHLLKLNDDEYMGKTRTKVSGWKRNRMQRVVPKNCELYFVKRGDRRPKKADQVGPFESHFYYRSATGKQFCCLKSAPA